MGAFLFAIIVFVLPIWLMVYGARNSAKAVRENWKIQAEAIDREIKNNNLDTVNAKIVYCINTRRHYYLWIKNDCIYLLCRLGEVKEFDNRVIPVDLVKINIDDIKYYFKDGQLMTNVVGTGSSIRSSLLFDDVAYSTAGTIQTKIEDARSCRLFFAELGEIKIIEFANDDFYTLKELIPNKDYEIFINNQKEELKITPHTSEKFISSGTVDIKFKLAQLSDLNEAGLITDEEYANKKDILLNSIIS